MAIPTNLEELQTARTAAGARYSAAIAELQDSLIELAAYDVALMNRNVSGRQLGLYQTFHGIADDVPLSLRHPQFGTYYPDWRGQVKSLADQVISNVSA
ncbi:hypothetical protein ABIE78_006381 [Sinorhizobium fredii]|uniref:Uncharacterized protein n=1 Tax=Sinorhizobium fredii (strain USDA 257) TaxID=1185652 RepID=I3XDN6_SINF2|nr:hypothetical protein [Sinorhizobium fredii]AFL53992.1 hypothetical protein USDA257_c54770 [Sinorhizobium fredii USDA 257]